MPVDTKQETFKSLYDQAESITRTGDMVRAITLFREALKLASHEGALNQAVNRLYNFAASLHEGATRKNTQVSGRIYFSAGLTELDAAIAIMELLTEVQPTASDIWYNLGLYCDNRCLFEKAVNAYQKAVSLDPEGPDAADSLLNLAIIHENKGRGILGIRQENLGRYVFDPNDPPFVEAEKLLWKAIAIGRKVISKDPAFKSHLSKMHHMLRDIYDHQFQGNKAVEQCLEMYKLNPEDNEVISWLKQAEKNTGKKLI